jgi:hypothetical protein
VKLQTLSRLLQQQGKVKLFVVADEFALCGYALTQSESALGVMIDFGASVRAVFATGAVLREPHRSGTMVVTSGTRFTRRMQTHRRHLAGRQLPASYFAAADEL